MNQILCTTPDGIKFLKEEIESFKKYMTPDTKSYLLRMAMVLEQYGFTYDGALGGGQPVFRKIDEKEGWDYTQDININVDWSNKQSAGEILVYCINKHDDWSATHAFHFSDYEKEGLSSIAKAIEHCAELSRNSESIRGQTIINGTAKL